MTRQSSNYQQAGEEWWANRNEGISVTLFNALPKKTIASSNVDLRVETLR